MGRPSRFAARSASSFSRISASMRSVCFVFFCCCCFVCVSCVCVCVCVVCASLSLPPSSSRQHPPRACAAPAIHHPSRGAAACLPQTAPAAAPPSVGATPCVVVFVGVWCFCFFCGVKFVCLSPLSLSLSLSLSLPLPLPLAPQSLSLSHSLSLSLYLSSSSSCRCSRSSCSRRSLFSSCSC